LVSKFLHTESKHAKVLPTPRIGTPRDHYCDKKKT